MYGNHIRKVERQIPYFIPKTLGGAGALPFQRKETLLSVSIRNLFNTLNREKRNRYISAINSSWKRAVYDRETREMEATLTSKLMENSLSKSEKNTTITEAKDTIVNAFKNLSQYWVKEGRSKLSYTKQSLAQCILRSQRAIRNLLNEEGSNPEESGLDKQNKPCQPRKDYEIELLRTQNTYLMEELDRKINSELYQRKIDILLIDGPKTFQNKLTGFYDTIKPEFIDRGLPVVPTLTTEVTEPNKKVIIEDNWTLDDIKHLMIKYRNTRPKKKLYELESTVSYVSNTVNELLKETNDLDDEEILIRFMNLMSGEETEIDLKLKSILMSRLLEREIILNQEIKRQEIEFNLKEFPPLIST
jgi:hypothetical protein